ncbi:MAG: DUF2752 domain-containing protein [Acidobacteria bacterium]|nr:DUF2752 domain-containing protein [Acidobacteriota bacterium]MBI3422010.1 DUF2752 domain-containing protein [Acidobacteriota bacterium]
MNETHSVNSLPFDCVWQAVPARPFSRADQIQYGVVIAIATATLGLARYLHPSARGFGTHEQLGLPACTFLTLTGIPCPSCGLTTSFAYAAHWQWLHSFVAQPFGFLAFCLTALSIPLAFYLLYRRVVWEQLLHARATNRTIYALLVIYLLSWCYKIYVMTS